MDESLIHTLLWSQLEYLEVPVLGFAFSIPSSWFESKLPGSFDPGFFLEAIVTRSIVALDYLEMCPRAMFFE